MITTSLLFLWGPMAVLGAVQFTTNGTSGPLCGRYKCLGQGLAACVDGKCVCQGQTSKGIGSFVCLRQDETYAVIFNDPMVRGFDGSHTKIPLISKFMAAHISTTTCTGATPDNVTTANGMCDLRFFAWGKRKSGKTFVRGIEVVFLVWLGNQSYHHTSRVEVEAFNGQHIYSEDCSTNHFGAAPFGNPVTTVIPGLGSIHTFYDPVDNFARIVAEPCGLEVGIRGVEQVADSLLLPAGMYIKVLEACEPSYLSNDNAIFSPPPGHGVSLAEQTRIISETINLPVTSFFVTVYKALTGQHMQDYPNASVEVQILADTVQECDVFKAYVGEFFCMFVVHISKFFRCFDKTSDGHEAVGLLGECIFSICDSNAFACHNVQRIITESGCHSKIRPGQLSILDFNCDSLSS